ncbi:winged helix-turn-helix transcriptional regulator [Nocardia terpenica]|uniref:HTH arsR-type domain-containing protein n=1 Tax=Nocardia terpenica TaxID=455432 RepID=A0A164PI92_9NOCA|nr:metalloregulator ArsR/SmtB family transcription factor [Nocardia terpenica]KZM75606.1 hypothetical protein AWN90_19765 [Nocardia terpenica]MBF6064743.1 winged helix-turn-helix transcriptional regulator [Nocardia terpenica]MBF6107258.1 winged helix-turn-helix transcriptional regulator [Nocardia terpenica]MBF6115015.1 winged helix-turn-helix transcriptional regulator [Nocardia terpenica]MBF6122121.1 winged helix-turn-helix transcriptional regulator [Nocardia terpenica]
MPDQRRKPEENVESLRSSALRRRYVGPDIAVVARLLADKTRVTMISALVGDEPMSASQLARIAGVSRATASEHLGQLVQRRLLSVERRGRHAYYRLASADVATILEALAALAPIPSPNSLRTARQLDELNEARICYDHLAGRLGVALADALLAQGLIYVDGDSLSVDRFRWDEFAPLGVRCGDVPKTGRPLVRPCLDWSERRYHLAGTLASMLTAELLDRGWIVRPRLGDRIVRVTEEGARRLYESLGVDPDAEPFGPDRAASSENDWR